MTNGSSPGAPAATTRPRELRSNWRTLITTTVGVAFGSAGALYYSQGIFYLPLAKAFGVSLTQVTGMGLVALVPVVIATIFYGKAVDRFGPRVPALIGILLFAATLATLGLYSGPFIGFEILWIVMSICSITVGPIAYARIVSGSFDVARGRALGITLAGVGVVGFLVPVPMALLISLTSYHQGYLALAVAALIPLIFLARLRPRAGATDANPVTGMTAGLSGWNAGRALRTGAYVSVVATFMLGALAVSAIQLQLSPILQSKGASPLAAAGVVSFVGAGVIVGRLAAGYLMGRVHVARIAFAMFLVTAVAIGLLLLPTTALAPVTAFFLGTALGMEVDMIAYLVGRFFGVKAFGTLYAVAYISVGVCLALGPILASVIFARTGSFTLAIASAIGVLILAAIATFFIPRTRRLLSAPASRSATALGSTLALAGVSADSSHAAETAASTSKELV